MKVIVFSVLLGLIPEVIYFTIFLINTKGIKEKRIKLAIGIAIVYFVCIWLKQYEHLYCFAFIGLVYAVLKILYKEETQIIDVFIISLSLFYIAILGFLNLLVRDDYSNYAIILILNRILLFIPFAFKTVFNRFYITYKRWWNRNREVKYPIKSVTLRGISLILFNSLVFIINLLCVYMIKKLEMKGGI